MGPILGGFQTMLMREFDTMHMIEIDNLNGVDS